MTPHSPVCCAKQPFRSANLFLEAVRAAARGLSREQIEHEILINRDLSKKGSPLRRLAYATRTASKAIALSAQ